MYLLNEGTFAVGAMTAAFVIAFLLVIALGAYVVYCDAQNRRLAEAEYAGIGHAEESTPASAESSTVNAAVAPAAAEPAERPARTPRRARPPKGG
jgi:hypothetical protein